MHCCNVFLEEVFLIGSGHVFLMLIFLKNSNLTFIEDNLIYYIYYVEEGSFLIVEIALVFYVAFSEAFQCCLVFVLFESFPGMCMGGNREVPT